MNDTTDDQNGTDNAGPEFDIATDSLYGRVNIYQVGHSEDGRWMRCDESLLREVER